MLARLFKRRRHNEPARALYEAIVRQSRRPEFYSACGVPDTLDGRFDMVAVHAFLVLTRLKQDRDETAELAQCLFDTLFLDMDRALRELGAGDLGVGKRVKAMARGFYGRIAAYEDGLSGPETVLTEALRRNLFGTTEPRASQLAALAAYTRREAAGLAEQATGRLLAGEVRFGAPPTSRPGPASDPAAPLTGDSISPKVASAVPFDGGAEGG